MKPAYQRVDRREIIAGITSALVAAYAPERIILFGSFAYGEPDEDSDIDLLIIKDTHERFLDRMSTGRDIASALHPRAL